MLKPTNRLISFSSTLGLMLRNTSSGTSNLESLVLGLLDSLTRGINLGHETLSNETVLGLELENRLLVVVNEAESSGFSSSELGAESKENDEFGVCLVHASNHLLEFRFGDIRTARVDDVHNHLSAGEQRIALELAGLYNNSFTH